MLTSSLGQRDVLLVFLGGVLLVGAVLMSGHSSLTDTHRHTVSVDTDAPVDEYSESYYHYEDLSTGSQEVFRETVESDSAVYTAEPAGPEFEYPGGAAFELYYIEYQNTTYVFETGIDRSPIHPILTAGVRILGVLGLLLILFGGYRIVTTANS